MDGRKGDTPLHVAGAFVLSALLVTLGFWLWDTQQRGASLPRVEHQTTHPQKTYIAVHMQKKQALLPASLTTFQHVKRASLANFRPIPSKKEEKISKVDLAAKVLRALILNEVEDFVERAQLVVEVSENL